MISAGRFFVLGFDGVEASDQLARLGAETELSGLVLFSRNIENPKQVRRLTKQLESMAGPGRLIVCTDQEGGRFQRLPPPAFGTYPAACDLSVDEARSVGARMGRELASLGINLTLAPVLDVNTNSENPIIGVRSFSCDPRTAADVGRLFLAGLHSAGVWGCGKHFPGHGDTREDSHLTLPTVRHPRERLDAAELFPFRASISSGIQFLMPAHIVYEALDPRKPATFSARILNGLLRQELGYRGLVITDDMGMAGAMSQGDLEDACVEAFAAGADLLLVCEHLDRHPELIDALEREIARSRALQARAEESSARLAALSTP